MAQGWPWGSLMENLKKDVLDESTWQLEEYYAASTNILFYPMQRTNLLGHKRDHITA